MMASLRSDKAVHMSVEDVSEICQTSVDFGLTSDEVARRKLIYGPNEFDIAKEEPLWKKYLGQVSSAQVLVGTSSIFQCM